MKNSINSICFLHGLVQPPTFHRDFDPHLGVSTEVVSWKLVAKGCGCEVVSPIAVAMRSFGARLVGKSGGFLEPGKIIIRFQLPSLLFNIAGWKMDHFDGIYKERWGFSWAIC